MSKPKYLVFDTETGGVDTDNDPVLQCFMMVTDEQGNSLEEWEWFIYDPDRPGSPEAAEVHGFTNEYLKEAGSPPKPTFEQIKNKFLENRDLTWVAFNANFDLSILDSEFKRYGVTDKFADFVLNQANIYDPVVLSREKDKYVKGGHRLETVAKRYGIEFNEEDAHSAVYDVQKTAEVAVKLAAKYGVPTKEQQRQWHKAWADNLTDYFARIGKKDEVTGEKIIVENTWPLRQTSDTL